MNERKHEFEEASEVQRLAADWTIKLDRGLTPAEQDAYTQWLAKEASHREAMKRYLWGWSEFDRLSGLQASRHAPIDPNLLAPGNRFSRDWRIRKRIKWGVALLPLAAAIALMLYLGLPQKEMSPVLASESSQSEPTAARFSRIEKLNLLDGSVVELNRGAAIKTLYSETERRLILLDGEANFRVAKDPTRPFVVEVDSVTLRALGTIFNVRSDDSVVDLIVTEGRVKVETSDDQRGETRESPVVTVGQRALVKEERDASLLEVFDVAPAAIEEALLWQPRLLDFDAVPLDRIVAEFNRRNLLKIVVKDEELKAISLSCSFWSDNVEGFVRLMELSFSLEAVYRGDEILLRREASPQPSTNP